MASKVKVNTIETESGSTLTLGQSGDTVTLASGASQTGFGRTGTVDWDTTAKTTGFTAVSGNGYFVNTTSGAITVTLPASPSAGDIVSVRDYANTAQTNNITVARNSSNIDGAAADLILSTKGIAVTLVYVDGTRGWVSVNSNEVIGGIKFVTATGGTETTCGNYKIHTFTGPGTFCVSCAGNPGGSSTVDYLVVAGGGGGGYDAAGGGGAGGYRESSGTASGCYTVSPLGSCVSALPVTVTGYPITVGAGGGPSGPSPIGPVGAGDRQGDTGSNSVFSTITSAGGGGGGGQSSGNPVCTPGKAGGAGGGAGRGCGTGGAGNTPPVSPPQGNSGGPSGPTSGHGSGGGGATAAGTSGTTSPTGFGTGGDGATSSINTTPTARAGGGGGGVRYPIAPSGTASGGTGGGGNGTSSSGGNGTVNTGGGAGGGGTNSPAGGGSGGSGIVIIRYKYQ